MRSPLKSLRSIPALVFAVATALSILVLPTQLHASSVTYDLTLTPDPGSAGPGGNGSFLIANGPVSSIGQVDTSATDFTVTIGGDTFSSAGPLFIRFLNGALNDIQFAETLADGSTLDISGVYAYYTKSNNFGGTISAVVDLGDPPAATPEPGSLILLGTGLLAGAGPLARRFRMQRS